MGWDVPLDPGVSVARCDHHSPTASLALHRRDPTVGDGGITWRRRPTFAGKGAHGRCDLSEHRNGSCPAAWPTFIPEWRTHAEKRSHRRAGPTRLLATRRATVVPTISKRRAVVARRRGAGGQLHFRVFAFQPPLQLPGIAVTKSLTRVVPKMPGPVTFRSRPRHSGLFPTAP